jgi:hypothetical protein
MRKLGKLRGRHIGGWWEPVRNAVWEFAGMSVPERTLGEIQVPTNEIVIPGFGEGGDEILNGVGTEAQKFLPMPETIVITYISRQSTSRRKLIPEDHDVLVKELEALVKRKNEERDLDETKKRKWELHVLQAEKMTKDEQVRAAAKTTVSFCSPSLELWIPNLLLVYARCPWKWFDVPCMDETITVFNRDRVVLSRGFRA